VVFAPVDSVTYPRCRIVAAINVPISAYQ
jgi:hypothetical protein